MSKTLLMIWVAGDFDSRNFFMTNGKVYEVSDTYSNEKEHYVLNDNGHWVFLPKRFFKKLSLAPREYEFRGKLHGFTNGRTYFIMPGQSTHTQFWLRDDHGTGRLVYKSFFWKGEKSVAYQTMSVEELEKGIDALIDDIVLMVGEAVDQTDYNSRKFDHGSTSTIKGGSVIQRSYEFNLGWAKVNPVAFTKFMLSVYAENPTDEWQLTVDNSRKDYVTYIANKK